VPWDLVASQREQKMLAGAENTGAEADNEGSDWNKGLSSAVSMLQDEPGVLADYHESPTVDVDVDCVEEEEQTCHRLGIFALYPLHQHHGTASSCSPTSIRRFHRAQRLTA
jgi:hypothetical protein